MANLTINNYSRTTSYSLPNGEVQGPDGANANVISLNLISQNAPDYTVPVNENFLYLLENFASTVGGAIDGPDKAIQGQLWYDTSTSPGLLKVNDSTIVDSPDWQIVSPQIAGNLGELQFNDGTDHLTATNNMTYIASNATLVLSNVASSGNANIAGELIVSGNANISTNLKVLGNSAITGNVTITGNTVGTGNITGGNLRTGGSATVTGNVTGGNLITAGNVTAKGSNTHVQYNNNGNLAGSSGFTFDGTNVATTGKFTATGNVTGGNLITAGNLSVTTNATITGNISSGNISTGGALSVTGNMSAKGSNTQVQFNNNGNLAGSSAFTFDGTNVATTGAITATGNVTGGNLVTGGSLSVTRNATVSGNATVTGNLLVSTSANVVANLRVGTSIAVGTTPTGNAGEIVATGNIIAFFSDDRLKTRLGNIETALDKVSTLATFYFEPNETAVSLGYTVGRDVGISAQELQAILPEAIGSAPISNNYLAIKHDRITPLLVAAIKELRNEVNEIKKKIG